MGLIPALKIDKLPLGDGVVMRGEIVAGDDKALLKFTKAFEAFAAEWRDRAAKDQTEIDFTAGVTLADVSLRADKPKLKARDYSIGIDMRNVSMEDRSRLFAMSQDKSKVLHVIVTSEPRRRLTLDSPPSKTDAPPAETKKTKAETASPADETAAATDRPRVIDHSESALTVPVFEADSLEERLQVALLGREGAAVRWAGRINSGLSDRDLIKAITSEWAGALYEAPDNGKHFIVQGGNKPKFRLAPAVGVRTQINGKPTLEGKALLDKVRVVLGIAAAGSRKRSDAEPVEEGAPA